MKIPVLRHLAVVSKFEFILNSIQSSPNRTRFEKEWLMDVSLRVEHYKYQVRGPLKFSDPDGHKFISTPYSIYSLSEAMDHIPDQTFTTSELTELRMRFKEMIDSCFEMINELEEE